MWCLVVFQHDLHGQYLVQSKEELPLKNIVSLKRRSWLRVHSHGIARNKYYSVIKKRFNFNCAHRCIQWMSQLRTTWSEMPSLMHFLRSPSLNQQTLTVPSAIVNSFHSSASPQRRPRKRKKNFLCCGRFRFLLVAFRNTTIYREGETKKPRRDRRRSNTFLGKQCQNKTSNMKTD